MFADGAYLTAGYRIDKEVTDLNTVRVDLSGLKIHPAGRRGHHPDR